MLSTNIKASQISNLTDARYFAAWGVEWLGFCFDYGHENYSEPTQVKAIKEWVVGPKIVGEFGAGQSVQEISEHVQVLGLDAVELGPFAELATIKQLDVPVIKTFWVEDLTQLDSLAEAMQPLKEFVQFFILDFTKSGLSWTEIQAAEALKPLCENYDVMLNLDMTTEQMQEIQEVLPIYGFSLRGGEEEKVGYKSFDQLDDIFDILMP